MVSSKFESCLIVQVLTFSWDNLQKTFIEYCKEVLYFIKKFTLIIAIINSLCVNICLPRSKNVAYMTTFVFSTQVFPT